MIQKSRSFSPWQLHFVEEEDFPYTTSAEKQSLSRNKNLLESLKNSREEIVLQNCIMTRSMHPILLI